MIFDTIRESMNEAATYSEQVSVYFDEHRNRISEASVALAKIKIIRASVTTDCIDLHITGDRHVLGALFGAFRRLGYRPDSRPSGKVEPSFSTYFRHPEHECQFWLDFSSSQCTRVKVGTETREVDIYETVCE